MNSVDGVGNFMMRIEEFRSEVLVDVESASKLVGLMDRLWKLLQTVAFG